MRQYSILVAMLLSGTSTIVHAQTEAADAAADDRRDVIIVTATGRSSAISTTKSATPIIESPQAISIISRDEIDLRASPTIADALSYTAGVQAESWGIDSRTDEVAVRGFGAGGFSSNNNFIDGLRLPAGGQWTRTGFDTFGVEQIEVLKGPSGALYGQTAPGGVVNLVTKRPTDQFHAEFMLQGIGTTDLGNWNYQAAADVSGPISSTLSARIVGLAKYGDTQVDGVKIGRRYISPSITWQPTDRTSWTILGQYQRDEGGSTFQFLPATGALYKSNGKYIANDANLGEPDWNTYNRNQYLIGSFFSHSFNDAITIRNNSRYTHIDTLYRVTVLSGDTLTSCGAIVGCIPGQTIARRAVQGDGETDGFATDTQLEGRFTTGAIGHTLLGGFDYFHTEWEHYRDLVNGAYVLPLLDIFNPEPRGSSEYATHMSPQVYTETVSKQKGVYLQDQMELGRLRVTVGGRQDWAKDNTYNPLTGNRYITKSDAFTWRVGAVYLFDNGLAPYASYSESFQPQVSDPTTSLTGEPFKPTTGQQYEAGLRYQHGNNIYLTLGAYQITQQNLTTSATLDDLPAGSTAADLMCGTATCLVQTGEGRVRGIEFEGKATLPMGLAVIATTTRSWSKVTKSNTASQVGNWLPQVPQWMASLFLNENIEAGSLAGLGFGGGVRYTGKSYGDTANALAIPDYTLFDLFIRYDLGKANPALDGMSFSVNARNIADKRYVATCSAVSACYYGQGRSVTARLQFRW